MKNPYKELSPYIESDAHSFKGRTSETEEMYESLDRNEYLVCHADSGEGKSSIIEAGLIPKMKANCYFPVRILFNSDEHFKKNNIDFDKVVCGIIENEIEKLRSNNSISVNVVYPRRLTNSDDSELTNWEKELVDSYAWLKLRYERVTIDNLLYTPVLIFDQFEEVFTNPLSQEWTDKFFTWLQELSTDLCPQRIINELEKHIVNDDFPEINTQKYFKAIFSLRSEYVGKLDYWGIQRHYIPLLKNNRYLLRPLTIKGAKEVITQQEGYDGLNAVADEIIDVLRRQQKGKNYVLNENSELPCIPALFLSIICSRAFSMSQEERTAFMQRFVAEKDEDKETAINSLIESFYEKAVADCGIPSKDMGVIEDILVNNEGNRQRVSSHADALKAIDFSTKYMKVLKDARLIRVIPEYNREDDSIEFVHDALCPIVAKKKELRLAEEAKKREEEKLREQAKKNRKRILLMSIIILIAFAVIGFFYYQNQMIEKSKWQIMETQARSVSEKAMELIAEGDIMRGIALVMNVLPDDWDNPDRPIIPETERALRAAHDSLLYGRGIVCIMKQHYGCVYDAVFSNGSNYIVTGSNDNTVRIWDVHTGNEIVHLRSVDFIYNMGYMSLSPDGKYLIKRYNSYPGTLAVYELGKDSLIFVKELVAGNHSAFSGDGKYLFVETVEDSIPFQKKDVVFDVSTWDIVAQNPFEGIYSPDRSVFMLPTESGIKLIESSTKKIIGNYNIQNKEYAGVGGISTQISGNNLYAVYYGNIIDFKKNNVSSFTGDFLGFCSDGNTIMVAQGAMLTFINPQNGVEYSDKEIIFNSNIRVAFEYPKGCIFVGLENGQSIIYKNPFDGVGEDILWERVATAVDGILFSPDLKYYAYSQIDSLYVYEISDPNDSIVYCNCWNHRENLIAINYDANIVITESFDYSDTLSSAFFPEYKHYVFLHNIRSEVIDTIDAWYSHLTYFDDDYRVYSFSETDNYLAYRRGSSLIVQDLFDKTSLDTIIGHANNITSVFFSRDGNYIISNAYDNTSRVWDIILKEEIVEKRTLLLNCKRSIISPNNNYKVLTDGKVIYLYDFDNNTLLENIPSPDGTTIEDIMFHDDDNRLFVQTRKGNQYSIYRHEIIPFKELYDKYKYLKCYYLSDQERKRYFLQ